MTQVLNALVTNAWEAMESSSGRVDVSVATIKASEIESLHRFPTDWECSDNDYASLTVSDTGGGMDAATLDRIFDPFFTDKFVGRGLGLAVALGIVKSCGGCITVKSRQDRGSVFRVVLPLSSQGVPRPRAGKAVDARADAAGGTVLLVEDEAMVRNMAFSMLKRFGFDVIAAEDGDVAVEIFRAKKDAIRLVLCDMTMPSMDGWKTLAALRKIEPDVPVILVSGYDEVRAMAGDGPERPNAFLHKPYRKQMLKMVLKKVLGQLPTKGEKNK
jgi:CheY-like chemotaxis protein